MLAGDLVLLIGPPMPERSMVRVQTKSSLPALRVMRLGSGLITHSPKKILRLRKPRPYTPPLRCNEDDDERRHICARHLAWSKEFRILVVFRAVFIPNIFGVFRSLLLLFQFPLTLSSLVFWLFLRMTERRLLSRRH